jgi:Fe-S cluster biogenesis protein NfuA/nitrite reductase/ring-hydroxylating ferredoxin subunit
MQVPVAFKSCAPGNSFVLVFDQGIMGAKTRAKQLYSIIKITTDLKMLMPDKKEFQQNLEKIEALVRTLESSADSSVRTSAIELMQALMNLHSAGIERMMEITFDSGEQGSAIIDGFAQDDLVASLLLLYGLHPLDMESRVQQALDKVRPYLRSHHGDVELLNITEGVVRLALQGSCDGCASSAMTLKLAIEEAIYEAAPDVTALEVEGVVTQPVSSAAGLVQLKSTANKNGSAQQSGDNGWKDVQGLGALLNGDVRSIDVTGRSILFCRLDETFYAYSDACPNCRHTMQAASLEATALACPTCGQRYDVRFAGRGLEQPNLHLEPFPLLVEQGQAKIALPALQR